MRGTPDPRLPTPTGRLWLALPEAPRSSEPARGAVATERFPGPARAGIAKATSAAEQRVRRRSGPDLAERGNWARRHRARSAAAGARPVGVSASAEGAAALPLPGTAAMPFLHGFRRIIFEYQPLVDAILGSLGIQDPERQEPMDG